LVYIKKLLIDYLLINRSPWTNAELNNLSILSIIALISSFHKDIPILANLRLKHYLKVGIDGSKVLIPNEKPIFIHSRIPALSRIIPGIYKGEINGGYREVILNFLSKTENKYFIEQSGVLTDFEYVSLDGNNAGHDELYLQIATELLHEEIQPADFTIYPLDYIYSWHKNAYEKLYKDNEIYKALILAEYFMVQKIIKKAKMPMFSDEPGDFINDYQEIINIMHDCFAKIKKSDKLINPTINIYDVIIKELR
jgi:hypothetical protein